MQSEISEIANRIRELREVCDYSTAQLAKELGIAEKGFRLVINTGKDGGQSVPHLHLHMTGGREHGWPAG